MYVLIKIRITNPGVDFANGETVLVEVFLSLNEGAACLRAIGIVDLITCVGSVNANKWQRNPEDVGPDSSGQCGNVTQRCETLFDHHRCLFSKVTGWFSASCYLHLGRILVELTCI